MTSVRLVLTTFADADEAARVIRVLVEEKLAACGTIVPGARSIYRWNGQIEDAAEVVVFLKAARDRVSELATRLVELHPYETPEVVVVPPDHVFEKYARWVAESCDASDGGPPKV